MAITSTLFVINRQALPLLENPVDLKLKFRNASTNNELVATECQFNCKLTHMLCNDAFM